MVRLDDDDGGLIPARSRVRRLQIGASVSTPPVAIAPIDREKGGESAATVPTPTGSNNVDIADGEQYTSTSPLQGYTHHVWCQRSYPSIFTASAIRIVSLVSPAVPILLSIEQNLLAKRRHRINFWHQRLRPKSTRKAIEMIQLTLSALDWRGGFPWTKKRYPKQLTRPRAFRFLTKTKCQRCLSSRTDTPRTTCTTDYDNRNKRKIINQKFPRPEHNHLHNVFFVFQNMTPSKTIIKDVCKLLAACEERICGVMKACGLGKARRVDNVPTASAAESANAAQQAFWHSGLNAAAVSRGNETATEGPGGCLDGRRSNRERTGIN